MLWSMLLSATISSRPLANLSMLIISQKNGGAFGFECGFPFVSFEVHFLWWDKNLRDIFQWENDKDDSFGAIRVFHTFHSLKRRCYVGVWLNYFFTRISWGNYAKKWGLLRKKLRGYIFCTIFFWTCWQIKGMSSDDNSTFYRENIIWFLFCAHFVKIDSLHKSCPIRNFFLPEKKM